MSPQTHLSLLKLGEAILSVTVLSGRMELAVSVLRTALTECRLAARTMPISDRAEYDLAVDKLIKKLDPTTEFLSSLTALPSSSIAEPDSMSALERSLGLTDLLG